MDLNHPNKKLLNWKIYIWWLLNQFLDVFELWNSFAAFKKSGMFDSSVSLWNPSVDTLFMNMFQDNLYLDQKFGYEHDDFPNTSRNSNLSRYVIEE